jgi:HSP20 family protein
MAIIKRTNELYPRIPSFFDDFLGGGLSDWFDTNVPNRQSSLPAVNIKDTEIEFIIELAAPGMNKEDFSIELEKGVLIISTEKKETLEENETDDGYFRKEFNYQSFQRRFRMPENVVNVEKIEANYKDGILNVRLPKMKERIEKHSRRIKIN